MEALPSQSEQRSDFLSQRGLAPQGGQILAEHPWSGPQAAENLALQELLTLHPSGNYCVGSLVFLEG